MTTSTIMIIAIIILSILLLISVIFNIILLKSVRKLENAARIGRLLGH